MQPNAAVFALLLAAFAAHAADPLLLQRPTLSKSHIVFSYAGDLWTVPRAGGDAIRLTAGPGVETDPYFSPDGAHVAFTGEYEGNLDVYVVPSSGGVPKRLTWHPAEDNAVGWTPDGKRILFRSARTRDRRLLTIASNGGPSEELPFPKAAHGSFSADGNQLAYQPVGFSRPQNAYDAWRRYRGGRAPAIWIAQMSDSSVLKVPRTDSNDTHPMWIGDAVYFLSDREGVTTLYAYDIKSKKVDRVLPASGGDIKSASAGPGAIVYEKFAEIRLYDLKSKKDTAVSIQVAGDLPAVRPRFVQVNRQLRNPSLSPTGARAIFEAHGEILTVPAEKGDARNITNTTGVHERTPSWSPDGKWIAYWSDKRGEYDLYLQNQMGAGDPRQIVMEERGFYFKPHWSPDSQKLAFTDNKLNLWVIDIEKNTQKKVATDTYYDPLGLQNMDPSWAPDSRWVSFTKKLPSHMRAVFVYSLETGQTHQITDGLSDTRASQFDRDGKYLYFTASTNMALSPHWLDMTSQLGRPTRSVYLVVLKKDVPSPFAPESDEEKAEKEVKEAAEAKKADEAKPEDKKAEEKKPDAPKPDPKKPPVPVAIDFENIGQRIVAVPMPPRDYVDLVAGKAGVFYIAESVPAGGPGQPPAAIIHKFDLKTRKADKLVEGVNAFQLSANGEKMLIRQGDRYTIAAATAPPKPGEGVLKTDALETRVDPKAEWKQMYDEVWRIQRDWFYDPKHHGLNLDAQAKKYRPYLDHLASRADLNYLFAEMLGDITVGHLYIRGGDVPEVKGARVGLLGADYKVENNRYRFARIFNGENWNPDLRAPLTQPGVNVNEGDYLIAVNGVDVTPAQDVYSYFEGTAGKQTVIKVGSDPTGANTREVTVVPIENEGSLRILAWVEGNRRKVDQMSKGRIAYVYLPDTGGGGFTAFNRYYFAQVGKEAAVIDERNNGGGQAADYIVDFLRRPLLNYWTTRYGEDFTTPHGAIFGPKVMIVNESAGSGGDALPWYFKRLKIGPLVGTRTWGGLVGILGYPSLMDGGAVTAPNVAFWNPEGEWDVENRGVSPDIEVDMDPKLVREGRDPQLERAVEVVMQQLEKNPLPKSKRPSFPVYNK